MPSENESKTAILRAEGPIASLLLVHTAGRRSITVYYLYSGRFQTERKTSILTQLKFHKLAGLKAPKAYYFQAETRVGGKKITFDVKQLAAHLKEIIHLNKLSKEAATRSGSIVRKENWQDASKAEKKKVLEKLTKEKNKRQVSEAKTLISDAIEDPSILVGKTFKHNIQETNDDTPEWYDGKIIGIDKIPKDKSRYL